MPCVPQKLAAQSDSPAHKQEILQIAQMWRDLAKQRQRSIGGSEVPPTSQ
jgi:hypothetical protein